MKYLFDSLQIELFFWFLQTTLRTNGDDSLVAVAASLGAYLNSPICVHPLALGQ